MKGQAKVFWFTRNRSGLIFHIAGSSGFVSFGFFFYSYFSNFSFFCLLEIGMLRKVYAVSATIPCKPDKYDE